MGKQSALFSMCICTLCICILCICILCTKYADAQDLRQRALTPAQAALVPALPAQAIDTDHSSLSRFSPVRSSNSTLPPNVKAEQFFFVQFTEFRFKHSPEVNRTPNEIVQSFDQLNKEGKIELIGSVRLTALEYHESTAQFGKTTSVTNGITRTAAGQQRSVSSIPLGTLIQVIATPQENKVLLKVAYTASRIDENVSEEKQPEVVNFQFNTTMLLEIGKATLVGGISADTNDFLMVTLTK